MEWVERFARHGITYRLGDSRGFRNAVSVLLASRLPIGQGATGAKRPDWTIHIGVVVRNIGDLMGLRTRFESGGRKDAILRSADGDEIAVEWEWSSAWGNELKKLREHGAQALTRGC